MAEAASVEERLGPGDASLRRRTARGSIVNAVYVGGVSSLTLLKGFIVAPFLSASEFGIWGIVVVSLGTLSWLRQVGIGDKYIQQEEADQELAFQKAFTLEAIFTGAFLLLALAMLPLFALLYGRPEIVGPGLVALLALPGAILAVPTWIYYRRMDFVRQRLLQSVDPLVGVVVTVALAVAGAGYWSFVIGLTAGAWVGGVVAIIASPYRLAFRYERGTTREYVSFSWPLFVAGFSSMLMAQASILAGETALGLAAAGAIALGSSVTQYAERVDEIVTFTLYPAICAVRDRTDLLLESFTKSNRLALMWGVPFGVGLSLFAGDLVTFVLGEQWRLAVPVLQAFGIATAIYQVGFNWSAFFRARGETRPMAVVASGTALAFAVIALPLMLFGGLEAFAWGMVATAGATLGLRWLYLTRLFSGMKMGRHLARAMAPSVPAIAAVLVARLAEQGAERSASLVLAELLAYLLVTVVATAYLERPLIREVLGYLGRTGGRSLNGPAAP